MLSFIKRPIFCPFKYGVCLTNNEDAEEFCGAEVEGRVLKTHNIRQDGCCSLNSHSEI